MGRDIIARGMASGAIKVNINAGHVFIDNAARDAYFVANPSELVENMYVYCDSKLQQYDGSIWIDRTPAIKGETGTGVPTGGTTNQVLTKNSNGDYDFSWIDLSGGGDMSKSLYDTANKQVDVYDMDNMEDGTTYVKTENNFTDSYKNKIDDNVLKSHTHENKTALDNTSGTNTGDETNATIISKIGYTPENTLNKGVNNGYCGLDSGGKVPLQNLPSTLLKYVGTWNAETNIPELTATDLTKVSNVYVVSHSGTQFGITWKAGDWLIYDADGIPEKSDNSDDVVSVNGKTGVVVIDKADVGLSNVANIDTSTTTNITDTSLKRFVSDVEKTTWNSKRDTLPEITQRTVSPSGWISVAYGNGIFVAVAAEGGSNRAMWSTDGITWTTVTVGLDAWYSVTYGNGIFVAVALSGTNRAMWSVDGITWNFSIAAANEWRSVTYGNGIFVAVGSSGTNRAMWSTDGITWTTVAVSPADWRSVTYGNGIFVAVALSGTNQAMWSVDGITWTTVAVGLNAWRSVTYGNGIFVAVGSSGTNRAMWSVDGITWNPVVVSLETWYSVTYGNGIFVAVASSGKLMWSVDGMNWYYKNILSLNWYSIGYGDGMFVALAFNSSDGLLTIGERTYSDKSRVIKKSIIAETTASLLTANWIGSVAPYTIDVVLDIPDYTVTSDNDINIYPSYNSNQTTAQSEMEAYSYLSCGEIISDNTIRFTCYNRKPTVNLNINIEILKKFA